MKYKLVKENHSMLKNFGRYRAKAVHHNTIDPEQLCREIEANCSAKASDVKLVLAELSDTLMRHLRNGDRVRLEDLGLLKLEIESDKVDTAEQFNARKHIRGVRLHFLPESREGRKRMYEDIKFEREKA